MEKGLREEQLLAFQGQAKTMLASLISGQKISNGVGYKGSSAEVRAKFLNTLQQVSLSAWIFNDIEPAFKTVVNTALPEGLDPTAKLNEKARGTHMFSELRPPTGDPAKAEWNAFFGKEGAALRDLNWDYVDVEIGEIKIQQSHKSRFITAKANPNV